MNNQFNAQQLEAINAPLGQTLVIAGAGSGKTKVLTNRINFLVNELNFYPSQIMAITFTNKAAKEMKERLKELVKDNFRWIGTFHSTCLQILREDIHYLNRDKNFNILDSEDQISILKECYKKYGIETKDYPYIALLSHIEKYKTEDFFLDEFKNEKNWKKYKIKNMRDAITNERVIRFYIDYCSKNNCLDFNDLLSVTLELFKNKEVREKWQQKFKYILVDEFQDTNDIQYELIKILSEKTKNIFAVGDPDQMIYSWRGANELIFKIFKSDFPETKLVILNYNYRSSQEILDASNNMIKNNYGRIHKDLIATHKKNIKPILFLAPSQDDESIWIVNRINELKTEGSLLTDIAILYRSNYLSRNIEQALIINGFNYIMFGGIKFYQRKEIKDIIAYLRTLYFQDDLSVKRIINTPRRAISQPTVDAISKYAEEHSLKFYDALKEVVNIDISSTAKNAVTRFIDLIDAIPKKDIISTFEIMLEKTEYIEYLKLNEQESKIVNIDELKQSIQKYTLDHPDNNLSDFLQEVSLYSSNDDTTDKDAINLMTIHIAKGLEFKHVFIIGLNEDIFPSKKALFDGDNGLQEERRIAYVAITRAKEQLFLSSFGGYNYISNDQNKKSRFIDEISSKFYEYAKIKYKQITPLDGNDWFDSSSTFKSEDNYNDDMPEFKVGDRLSHTLFGEGIVIGLNGENIDVSFKHPYGTKTIVGTHKSIKRVVN